MTESPGELAVIIPAYNEEETVGKVVEELMLLCSGRAWEIIVVDDASTDRTAECAQTAGARVIRHERNRGYGAALKTGIRATHAAWVATFDADGQHTAMELSRLLPEIGRHDLIVGARTGLLHSSAWRMPGKWALGVLANYLCEKKIPDLNSGMRIFRREVIVRYLHLCPEGFSFSTTSTMVMFNRRYSVVYVPITVGKTSNHSQVRLRTGWEVFVLMLRLVMLFDPLRVFLPIAATLLALGLAWGVRYVMLGRGLSVAALLLLLVGVVVFLVGLLADQVAELRKEKYE
ncbi:MAG: glycosyltransferase family 2 protein [Myxococcales bacterium]|nr:glycosyltransferase family 2 protein [Myxococcales bacterium]